MQLDELFLEFFKRNRLPADKKMIVAVSGGIDSVVLCRLCHHAGFSFSIAHANFGLRGEESSRDETFVRKLANELGVSVAVKKFDTEDYAKAEKLSIQEAARNLRYEWFRGLLNTGDAKYVLLAHQANDNVETLLMNFFRGTGLEGLTGIKELSPDRLFARPLLHATRKSIEAYAQSEGLTWVEDSSNASSKYTRNFFRNELLPAIKKVYPNVEENLLNNLDRFKEINELYQSSITRMREGLCQKKGTEVWIPVRKLQKSWHPSLVYELIKDHGFNEKQVDGVFQLLSSPSGKFIANAQWQIIRHRNWLVIAPRTAEADTIVIEQNSSSIAFRNGTLQLQMLERKNFQPGTNAHAVLLDAHTIGFPLLLRPWKAGDYFYPLGMRKKKKLARFLIDSKFPKHQKESVWVLESNRRIIWVVGLRIDDRFKIKETTTSALSITLDHNAVGG